MQPVIFLLLVYISSIISKSMYNKPLLLCMEPQPMAQRAERRVALPEDQNDNDRHSAGYEVTSTALKPVVQKAGIQKDSQNTSILDQVDDITIDSNDTDVNKKGNVTDINKEDNGIDINEESNVNDINKENDDTNINKEGNLTDINESNDIDLYAKSNVFDINYESNVTDINEESDVTDINEGRNVTDISDSNFTDINDISQESNVTNINNESNNNSTQVDPTVTDIGIDQQTVKTYIHDDSKINTKIINNISTVTVNKEANITEKSPDKTNESLSDDVQDNNIDINNMREVRAHLLDHLLEYFVNIIKQDQQYTQTRKKYIKDKMKLEDKLRNYYNPVHLEEFLKNNNSDNIDVEEYSNGRREADESTDDNIIEENEKQAVTTSNINIKTDENPVHENSVTNGEADDGTNDNIIERNEKDAASNINKETDEKPVHENIVTNGEADDGTGVDIIEENEKDAVTTSNINKETDEKSVNENSVTNGEADDGTDNYIIEQNEKDAVISPNINIETDENPVNENSVTNKSLLDEIQNNKTEVADLHLQNDNKQDSTTADDKTNNEKLLKVEENANILPIYVAIGDNTETYNSTSTTKTDTNDAVTEKGLQNTDNNMKSIKEIDGRQNIPNSDGNNNLNENPSKLKTEDKNASITLGPKPAKKSIKVKILDFLKSSLKIKAVKKLASKGITEDLLEQKKAPCPYNLILQFNIHI